MSGVEIKDNKSYLEALKKLINLQFQYSITQLGDAFAEHIQQIMKENSVLGMEIGAPELYFLRKGAFERYKEYLHTNGKEIGQHKPVRIIDTEEKKEFFFGERM